MKIENLREAVCGSCPFSKHCGGWDRSPYCLNEQAGLYEYGRTRPESDDVGEGLVLAEELSNEPNGTLFEYLTELSAFLTSLGYLADVDEIFKTVSKMRGEFRLESLVKATVVKSRQENERFYNDLAVFDSAYFGNRNALEERKRRLERLKEEHERRTRENEERLEEIRRKRKKRESAERKSESPVEKARSLEAKQSKISGLKSVLSESPYLADFVAVIESGKIPERKVLVNEVAKATKRALKRANSSELTKAAKDRMNVLTKATPKKVKIVDETDDENEELEIERTMEEESRRYSEAVDEIMKESSKTHRTEFVSAGNAVKSTGDGERVSGKLIEALTKREKEALQEYVNENVRKLRTRIDRKTRTSRKARLDLSETARLACGTGGTPMRLAMKKPRRRRTNLIMFLDVSGSCRNASELMLRFMGAMKDAFPGGCRTYAFTDRLYDVSGFYESRNMEHAAGRIIDSIPSAGVYSNYERPLREFCEGHMSEVTRDSIVYFIGDARNNKNESGSEFFKRIARRSKRTYWLNTEPKAKWNEGDSIIGEYAKYADDVVEVLTTRQLADFLGR